MTYRIVATALFLISSAPAFAHPDAHLDLTPAEWLAHMVASPFHMATIAAVMAALGGFVLLRRRSARSRTRK